MVPIGHAVLPHEAGPDPGHAIGGIGRPWVSRWTETELRLGWERKSVTEFDRSTDMAPESKGR